MVSPRRSPRARRFDGHALVAFAPVVPLLPAWLASMWLFWWVLVRFAWTPFPLFAGAVLALGVLLFDRNVQKFVLTRLLGARRPTREEAAVLDAAWRRVTQAVGTDPRRFVLAVFDSDDLNAFASGGHLVVVSSYAIHNLSEDELAGVLAHELCHHLGMHTVALTVAQWLVIPVIVLARIGLALQRVARAATDAFTRREGIPEMVGRLTAGVLTAVSWVFLAFLTLSRWTGNLVGKGSEFRADEMVVAMGFGPQLRDALRAVRGSRDERGPRGWRERIVMSHPPARTRLARIEADLRAVRRLR